MPGGRPSEYTWEQAVEICAVIAAQGKGIKRLCRENKHWPHPDTIYTWLGKHKEFADLYRKAKRQQMEVLVDEMIDIADDTSNDSIIKVGKDGEETEVCNTEWVNRARLRVDARKWVSSKLCPRLYGDKVDTVKLNFPKDINDPHALTQMSAEVFRALCNEEISPEHAKTLISSIKDHGLNIALTDLSLRLNKLETGDDNGIRNEERCEESSK